MRVVAHSIVFFIIVLVVVVVFVIFVVVVLVAVVVILVVSPLLVIVVCKRACDRLSYTTLVTSSRRTLRYLAREREHTHAHVHALLYTGWRVFDFEFYSVPLPSDIAISGISRHFHLPLDQESA